MENKGFLHTGDPTIVPGTPTENLPDGNYTVSGISRFISIDDKEGRPIFSSSYGSDLKVAFEFKVVGQDQGLACSLTPAQFYVMALLFGADLSKVNTFQ